MKISKLFTRTSKNIQSDEVSRNAQLLMRAGFIDKLMAGAYSYLPLGLRVLNKIENIIREEMNSIDGQEILLPGLHPKEIWERTGRWDTVDVLFKLKGSGNRDLALGPTHEEVVTPVVSQFVKSYKDLPFAAYQIQTKYRNEARAKSGLLRGREFRMKDMYSFHANQQCLDEFYERVVAAYKRVYERCGLGEITYITFASGGMFSTYSHEFQTVTEYGEDTIYLVPGTNIAINKEIINDENALKGIIPAYQKGDEKKLQEARAIEVGNIFKLGTKFSDAFSATYADEKGSRQSIIMGCYGIGPSRVMGTVAECLSDKNGLAWPSEISPYTVHLVSLFKDEAGRTAADSLYQQLEGMGIDVLYDDRTNISSGQKFSDADLIGIPIRIVVSPRTISNGLAEIKLRKSTEVSTHPIKQIGGLIRSYMPKL